MAKLPKSTFEKTLARAEAARRRMERRQVTPAEVAKRIMQDPIAFHSATQYHGMELTGSHQPSEDALLREALGWAEIAHRAIADRVSMLRPIVQRRVGAELEPVPDHPLQTLLDRPNEDFSRAATQRLIAGHLVLVGESYLLKVRAQGLRRPGAERNIPTELWLMHPARTTPLLVGGRVAGFLVQDGDGRELRIEREDVIRLWLPDVENIYGSRGYLGPQAATVDADKFSDETVRTHFMHDAVPRVVIEAKDDAPKPSDPELRRHDEMWRAAYNRRIGTRRGLPAWLPTGFTAKELSALGGMSELVPLKNHYRDKVLMAFGVPRSIVGDVVDANRAAAETNQYVFDLHTVSPITGVVADGLTSQLAPDFGDDLVVGYEEFVASDKAFELTRTESELRSKIRVINEVREERGEDEVPWGDLPVGTMADVPYTGEELEPFDFDTASDDDESDGAPDPDGGGKGFDEGSAITASNVLNGAQVTAITDLMMQVAAGTMPRVSAIELMGVAFGIDADTAGKILPAEGTQEALDEPRCRELIVRAGLSFSFRALRPATPEVRAEWERERNNERRYVPGFDKLMRAIFGIQERQTLKALRDVALRGSARDLTADEIRGALADLYGGPDAFRNLFEQRVERFRRRAFERMAQESIDGVATTSGLDLSGSKFSFTQAMAANLARQAAGFRRSVNDTTLRRLSRDITKAVAEGIAQGESTSKIAKRIERAVKGRMRMQRKRARAIAQQEMGISASTAKLAGWEQSGIVERKRWHTSLDDAVRDSHEPMEGVTAYLHEPFTIPEGDGHGAEQAMAPRLGVEGARLSAHNSMGCRCFTSAVLDGGES